MLFDCVFAGWIVLLVAGNAAFRYFFAHHETAVLDLEKALHNALPEMVVFLWDILICIHLIYVVIRLVRRIRWSLKLYKQAMSQGLIPYTITGNAAALLEAYEMRNEGRRMTPPPEYDDIVNTDEETEVPPNYQQASVLVQEYPARQELSMPPHGEEYDV